MARRTGGTASSSDVPSEIWSEGVSAPGAVADAQSVRPCRPGPSGDRRRVPRSRAKRAMARQEAEAAPQYSEESKVLAESKPTRVGRGLRSIGRATDAI